MEKLKQLLQHKATPIVALVILILGGFTFLNFKITYEDGQLKGRTTNPGWSKTLVSSLITSLLDDDIEQIDLQGANIVDTGDITATNGYFTNLTANVLTASTTSAGTSTFENLTVTGNSSFEGDIDYFALSNESVYTKTFVEYTTSTSAVFTVWTSPVVDERDVVFVDAICNGQATGSNYRVSGKMMGQVTRNSGDNVLVWDFDTVSEKHVGTVIWALGADTTNQTWLIRPNSSRAEEFRWTCIIEYLHTTSD